MTKIILLYMTKKPNSLGKIPLKFSPYYDENIFPIYGKKKTSLLGENSPKTLPTCDKTLEQGENSPRSSLYMKKISMCWGENSSLFPISEENFWMGGKFPSIISNFYEIITTFVESSPQSAKLM
jgi:hypothetical protein